MRIKIKEVLVARAKGQISVQISSSNAVIYNTTLKKQIASD